MASVRGEAATELPADALGERTAVTVYRAKSGRTMGRVRAPSAVADFFLPSGTLGEAILAAETLLGHELRWSCERPNVLEGTLPTRRS